MKLPVFDSLIRHLGVVIFQVVFNANALLSYPFLFRVFQDVSDLSVTFLYLSLPSVSPLFLFSYLLLSHRSMMSEVTHGLFMRRCLPRISLAVSVTAVFITVTIVSMLFSFSSRMSGVNFPHIFAWKAFATVDISVYLGHIVFEC